MRDLFSALVRPRDRRRCSSSTSCGRRYIVPETKDLAALLAEFRRTNQHMAIVVDEYGDARGDRHARGRCSRRSSARSRTSSTSRTSRSSSVDDDTMRIDGTFPIDDFNEQFDRALPIEDYHTVGGFVFGAARSRRRSPATRSKPTAPGSRCSKWRARGSSGSRSSCCRRSPASTGSKRPRSQVSSAKEGVNNL